MTEYLYFSIYSLIQGITEFIPISSSGHLNMLEILKNNTNERNYLNETTVHFASLLALLIYLSRNSHFLYSNIKSNFLSIICGTVPAIIVGLLILKLSYDFVSLKLIGWTSIFGGVLLFISDYNKKNWIQLNNKFSKFIFAGFFQCLAFLPGFSRSGSCIIAFRILGEDRKQSSIYSLYMGLPIITLSFLSNFTGLDKIVFNSTLVFIFVITFFSAYITLVYFIKFINKIGFTPFVIYRIILGLIILIFFS